MQKRLALTLLAVPLLALPLMFATADSAASGSSIVDSFVCKYSGETWNFVEEGTQVLVRFEATSSLTARDRLTADLGLTEVHSSDNDINVGVYSTTGALSAARSATELSRSSIVYHAQPLLLDNEGFPQYTIAGQFTVQFMPGLEEVECEEIIRDFGSAIVKDNWTPGYYTITIPDGLGLYEAIRLMNRNDLVWFSEESMMGFNDATFVPNDPNYGSQWHLNNTGQSGGTSGADIHAQEAWDLNQGDPDVVIVIIDTGVDQDHPDLQSKLYPRNGEDWDFSSGPSTNPDDTSGHGTSCAGLAAAETNNGVGVAGACPDCRIIGLKINLGSGQNDNRADAINYAVQFDLDRPELRLVLSNSWRMSSGSFAAVEAACQNASDNDVPILVASGNGNGAVDYPARYATTLAIGASSPCDERKSPTSCDPENFWGSNFGPEQDVVAPGVLMSTTSIGGGYTTGFNGTSSACPTAAGVVGLILSANPLLTFQEVEDTLEQNADDQVGPPAEDPPGWDQWMGWGRINAHQALLNVPGQEPPTISLVTPECGRVNLSNSVTITGTNFSSATNVDFDGTPATFVTLVDATTIIAGVPVSEDLITVDARVSSGVGSDTLVDAYTYFGTVDGPDNAAAGSIISISSFGPRNGNYGVVYDYFTGSRFKKGVLWPINFTPGVWGIMHDSFRTADNPLNGFGQGGTSYTIPDTPQLPSMTLHVVSVFDGNGPDSGRPLVLSKEMHTVVIN